MKKSLNLDEHHLKLNNNNKSVIFNYKKYFELNDDQDEETFNFLHGKTIKSLKRLKLPKYVDDSFILMKFTDGSDLLMSGGHTGQYSPDAIDEYISFLGLEIGQSGSHESKITKNLYNILYIKDPYGENIIIYLTDDEFDRYFEVCDDNSKLKIIKVNIKDDVELFPFWDFVYNSTIMKLEHRTIHINKKYICLDVF